MKFVGHLLSIYKYEILIVFFVLILASIPRVVFLSTIPLGLHGDEAWTGLDARRLIQDGHIPIYVGSALGQPTGPIYFTALIFRLFGDSVFWLRLSMALFGIATIPLFYVFVRQFSSKTTSLLTTIVFCFSGMHIHFSRIAFMLISAPFFQLISLILLVIGIKKGNSYVLILGGAFAGLGAYSYNTYPLFLLTLALFFVLYTIRHRTFQSIKKSLCFLIPCAVVTCPLLVYILMNTHEYFSHHATVTSLKDIDYSASIFSNILKLIGIGLPKLFSFFVGNKVDFGDAYGQGVNFDLWQILFALGGIVLICIRKSKWGLFILASSLIVLLPSFLTIDGIYRREIIYLTYFYFFIAFYIEWLISALKPVRSLIIILMCCLIATSSAITVYRYFFVFPYTEETQFVFPPTETVAASMAGSNKKTEVILFFSNRWSCHYETIRYLLPTIPCEDRSTEWGTYSFASSKKSSTTLIFGSGYTNDYSKAKKIYPHGKLERVVNPHTNAVLGYILKI